MLHGKSMDPGATESNPASSSQQTSLLDSSLASAVEPVQRCAPADASPSRGVEVHRASPSYYMDCQSASEEDSGSIIPPTPEESVSMPSSLISTAGTVIPGCVQVISAFGVMPRLAPPDQGGIAGIWELVCRSKPKRQGIDSPSRGSLSASLPCVPKFNCLFCFMFFFIITLAFTVLSLNLLTTHKENVLHGVVK